MNTPSQSGSSVHPRKEDEEGGSKKIKRPRAKLTCLNCKRRKTKCDKTHPCSSCVTRGEGDACAYEEGYEPITESFNTTAGYKECKAIQDRLDRIERAISSTKSPPTPSRNGRTTAPAATQERAHGVLVSSRHKLNNGPSPMFQSPSIHPTHDNSNAPGGRAGTQSWPSIILDAPPIRRSARWNNVMSLAFEALPRQGQMEFIIDHYFSKIQLLGLHIIEGVFRTEMSQFFSLRSLNLHFSIDPAWLAQLIGILWVTCHYLAENEEILQSPTASSLGLSKPTIINLATGLYDALEMALTCSSWLFKPQIRILQTMLVCIYLNMQGCFHTGQLYGPPPDWTCCLWFDIAVGICKGLELHLDPTIQDIAKMNDPALPPSKPVYSVQVIRRAFHDLLLFDTYTIVNSTDVSRNLFPYSFPDESVLTPPPSNYTEEALISEGESSPRSEKTSFIWTLHQNLISQEWRRIVSLLENIDQVPYSAIMERSRILRDAFTDFLALKAESELSRDETDAFALTYSSYQQRFLRLHRPFFIRGYRDSQYDYSKTTVVNVARQIAKTHRRLLHESSNHSMVKSAVFIFQHHITALPILLLNALYDTSSASQMRQELVESSEAFIRSFQSGFQLHVRIAAKGVCIANEMIRVIDNPPKTNSRNIEEILRSVNINSKANEARLMETAVNLPTTFQPNNNNASDVQPYQAGMTLTSTTMGSGQQTLVSDAEQNWWDLE
uniref:Zn(2)-C6 fungal-type domain-containing protein n=1 Tax=Kwoniella bestiolae CBS 10118 TaxID=1296100 RepID=A0A1B9G2K8_9TREE|nr:hypothetical protein I302_05073 [Kwoniella bestiolae CBS 10118]OCF25259.1 hypothetical protein I302_05073 [Kwoniella bestiolae CBS 10118]